MPIKFSGINIISKEPVKSFEFYKGLGLPVSEEAEDDGGDYGASFDIGGAALWIWRDQSGNNTENTERAAIQIVIGCADIGKTFEEFHDELKSKGYAVSEVELMSYGGKEMNLTDPDGNKILFLD